MINRQQTSILGVPFDQCTFSEALKILQQFLTENKNHSCFTPNPEMVMGAQKDTAFLEVLMNADLVIPDGIGVVIASKFYAQKLTERVAGCDLVQALFKTGVQKPLSVYLLGSKPGVCEKAKEKIENQYKGINVIGHHDGYFDADEEKLIIQDIQSLRPDVLLVGLGFPKQEKWIAKYQHILPVKISMGVGGTIDVLAGTVKRAPLFYQKFGLEWFYRLLKQPSRIGRMMQLPIFILHVLTRKER